MEFTMKLFLLILPLALLGCQDEDNKSDGTANYSCDETDPDNVVCECDDGTACEESACPEECTVED